jgi:hypothetical protein
LLVGLSILFLLTGEGAGIVIGLIGIAIAYHLFGRPGLKSKVKRQSRPLAIPSRPVPQTQVSPPTTRRAATAATIQPLHRLNELSAPSRIAVVNHLEADEDIEFVLSGANRGAVIGTDRHLFVIPDGRNGHEHMLVAPYESLTNVRIEHERNGARLLLSSDRAPGHLPSMRVANGAQVELSIQTVQQIKRRIALAQQTQAEEVAPDGQSAFIETAHRALPSARPVSSLSLGDMLEMTPTEFEEFTGRALESLGYSNVNRVGGSGDLAADLTATDPQGRSAIVQCKRYTPGSKVGSPALQSFIGMKSVHHRAERGIFVTTADYSQQAIDLAKQHDIVLIDGDDLVKIAALALTPHSTRSFGDETNSIKFCPACGTRVVEGAKFCGSCGTGL